MRCSGRGCLHPWCDILYLLRRLSAARQEGLTLRALEEAEEALPSLLEGEVVAAVEEEPAWSLRRIVNRSSL